MIKVPVQGKRNPVASSIFLVKDQLFKILPKFEPYFSINGGGEDWRKLDGDVERPGC